MQRTKRIPQAQELIEWRAVTEGSQLEAVATFTEAARALPVASLKPMHFDMELCYVNVSLGERSLRSQMERFLAMPDMPRDIFETIRGTLLATYFQADLVKRTTAEKIAAELDLEELRHLRMLFKTSLEACGCKGLFPPADVKELKEIAKGTGTLDAAQDCIRYAAFYRRHAEILKNKTPIEPADITRAEELGQRVRDQLALEGHVRATTGDEVKDAIDLRDRFFTLLVNAYDLALSAAPFLFGKDHKNAVPSMQSRRGLAMLNRKPKPKTKTPDAAG